MTEPERNERARMLEKPLLVEHQVLDIIGHVARSPYVGMWVLIREPNPTAFPYMLKAMAGYEPKGIDCKPKTADNANHPCAGLVASPFLHRSAFSVGRLANAVKIWHAFESQHLGRNDGHGYALGDARSRHPGCLKRGSSWVCGDIDLFDVVKVGASVFANSNERIRIEMERGEVNKYTEYARIVRNKINNAVRSPVVQHGAHAQFADFEEGEALYVFSPAGKRFVLGNHDDARAWYRLIFPERATVLALARGDKQFEGARPYAPANAPRPGG